MPTRRPKPKFSGALAEPIYDPVSTGVLAMPDDAERHEKRVVAKLKAKHELLLDHYGIDKSGPNKWYILSLRLALDCVPGMKVYLDPPPKPGRKRTWKAGLGTDLLHAAEGIMQHEPHMTINKVIAQLRQSGTQWSGFSPENLVTRLREERRKRRLNKKIAELLLGSSHPYSIGQLAPAYLATEAAGPRKSMLGGLYGLGQSVPPRGSESDENSGE